MTASLPVSGLTSSSGAGFPAVQHQPQRSSHRPLAVAAAPALRLVAQSEGLLQIHTAPFRGSFGAVLSQALRSAGLGSRVLVTQFLKGGVDQGLGSSVWLCGRLQWLRPGVPGCLSEPAAHQGLELLEAVRQVWAFSREQLVERVWKDAHAEDERLIDTHVSRLRKKVEEDPTKPLLVVTVRGIGYRLEQRND